MQLRFVSLLFVLYCFSACKEKSQDAAVITVEKSSLKRDAKTGVLFNNQTPFTGKAQRHYLTGTLAEATHYVNGIKHGLMLKWFPGGNQSYSAYYQNGQRSGEVKSWWSNGQLRSLAQYENDIAHGIQQEWYKSGQIFKQYTLVKGQEEGLQQAWRENGKLYNNYEAKEGRIYGLKRSNLCFELQDEQITAN